MNITIFALHLGFGGVERYICTIANMLSQQHHVKIISTYRMIDKPAFYLHDDVEVEYLLGDIKPNTKQFKDAIQSKNVIRILKEGLKACKILYHRRRSNIKAIKACNSDVVISTRIFHNNLISKYASTNIIKITSEHNHHNNNESYIKKVIHSCRNFQYLLPISKELTEFYQHRFAQINSNINVMYIPYAIEVPDTCMKHDSNQKRLISVGRLSKEKGYEDLIEMFYRLHQQDSEYTLEIIGDGLERETIEHKIRSLNLNQAVTLHGYRDKSYINNYLKESSLYVMCSFSESFGIVLLEAMSYALPCIAFSSAQGANDIIENKQNGYLIDQRNIDDMVSTILKLTNNQMEYQRLSQNAYHSSKAYSETETKKQWLDFMKQLQCSHWC